jgi:GNAT superfamily N-acetyltransferase
MNVTPLTIRAVERADYPAWRALFDGYNAFYGRSGSTSLPEEVTQATWSRFFDYYEPMHALVAERKGEHSGELIGLAHFLYHRSTTHIAPLCFLQDLFTAPSARGQGAGRALITAVYDHARQAGSSRVYWMTQQTNQIAMKLYDQLADKSGFIVYRHTL